jgi:hypothetical protein
MFGVMSAVMFGVMSAVMFGVMSAVMFGVMSAVMFGVILSFFFSNAPLNCRISSATNVIFMEISVAFYTVMIIKSDVSEIGYG